MRAAPTSVAAAMAGAWTLPALAPLSPVVCSALGIPRRIDHRPVAYLTFDDGPHPLGTPAILATLADHGARATFFLVGEQVRRAPALTAEIAAAGHAVELHGDRHRNQLRLTPAAVADDLRRGAEAILAATGRQPEMYRPPYGIFSAGGLATARRLGLQPLLWSRWGRDWRRSATPSGIAARVSDRLEAGDVLLLHDSDAYSAADSWRATSAALPLVLDAIVRHGLSAEALSAEAITGCPRRPAR